MNALITVWAKELTDLFRDRRTMMVTFLMGPLLMPLLIIGILKLATDRMSTQTEKALEVPVVGADNAPNLIACYEDDVIFQNAAFEYLQGKFIAKGKLPVTVCSAYSYGSAVTVNDPFPVEAPESVGMSSLQLAK